MQTTQKKSGLQNRTAQQDQSAVAKYVIVLLGTREQVVTLPFESKHADVFNYLQQEWPGIKAVSAGFIVNAGNNRRWVGGESTSLGVRSRSQDGELIEAFLASEDRRSWDLAQMAVEAKQTATRME